jgi:hypothetical protein
MTKTRMVLFAAAGVAALVAINAARDGGESPRVSTRTAAPLQATAAAPVAVMAAVPSESSVPLPAAAPGIVELERALADSEPGARDLVLQKFLPTMVADNAGQMARFAELQTDPALRELALRQVALLWGARDPARAIDWARSLPDAAERDATFTDVANGLSSVDPARAVQLREQFAGSANADSTLSNLVQQWAGFDFDAALAWTEARAPGAQRDELMQRLVYVRAASGDPAAAARLVSDSSLAGAAKDAAIASVTQEWARSDGAAALEWLQTVDPDKRSIQAEEIAIVGATAN